jgi:hypothetical protein
MGVALANLYAPSVHFLTYASSFATEPPDAPNAGCGIRRGRIVLGDLLLSASGPRSTSLARAGRLRLGAAQKRLLYSPDQSVGATQLAFVEIPTLSGGQVLVSAGGVYRITRGIQGAGALTRVEFGAEDQLTGLAASAVADLLRNAGANFIELTAADGTQIFLSVPAIIAVRDSDAHSDPPGARAVVNVAGHRQAVRQTRQQVQQALAAVAQS